MADTEYDHCPREQRLRTAAHILADAEKDIASECGSLLLRLTDPNDLPDIGVEFYHSRRYFDEARRKELTKRAARAAMAVLLADDGMQLPEFIEVAYDMPKSPAVEFQWLLQEQRNLNATLHTLAAELEQQRRPAVRRLIDLARQAQGEIALEAEQRETSGNDENAGGIKQLAADLRAAIEEAAA